MPLIARLLADHAAFRALGQALEAQVRASIDAQDPARVLALANEFKLKLDAHSALEDRTLYPAYRTVMDASPTVNAAFMNHLDNEHRKVDEYLVRMLEQIQGGELSNGWAQSFALFSIGLRTHLRKEEESLFPEAARLLGSARLNVLDA